MGACYQFQIVRVVELLRDVLSEGVAGASWRDTPAASVIWVRPEKIADWSLVRHLHDPIELLDLVEGVDTWRQATVQTENTALDDCGERQVVEERSEVQPHLGISVLPQAFVVKAVDLGDLLAFVITT